MTIRARKHVIIVTKNRKILARLGKCYPRIQNKAQSTGKKSDNNTREEIVNTEKFHKNIHQDKYTHERYDSHKNGEQGSSGKPNMTVECPRTITEKCQYICQEEAYRAGNKIIKMKHFCAPPDQSEIYKKSNNRNNGIPGKCQYFLLHF